MAELTEAGIIDIDPIGFKTGIIPEIVENENLIVFFRNDQFSDKGGFPCPSFSDYRSDHDTLEGSSILAFSGSNSLAFLAA